MVIKNRSPVAQFNLHGGAKTVLQSVGLFIFPPIVLDCNRLPPRGDPKGGADTSSLGGGGGRVKKCWWVGGCS